MIVDDHDMFRGVLKEALSLSRYQVIEASSGPECLELARQQNPDVILMDIAMPGMSGHEAFQLLRDDPLTSDIPVIVLTALKGKYVDRGTIEAEVDDYLNKPCNLRDLELAIDKQLARRADKGSRK
jgi:two-component system cell cycle response regulator